MYGNLGTKFASDLTPFRDPHPHAWVVIADRAGNELILDPSSGKYGSTNRVFADASNTRTRRLTGRINGEEVVHDYKPDEPGSTTGPRAMERRDLEAIVPTFLP